PFCFRKRESQRLTAQASRSTRWKPVRRSMPASVRHAARLMSRNATGISTTLSLLTRPRGNCSQCWTHSQAGLVSGLDETSIQLCRSAASETADPAVRVSARTSIEKQHQALSGGNGLAQPGREFHRCLLNLLVAV